ncbi:MAG: hypothetical protein PHT60_16505 [Acidiphilium sp.]|nr:hypothetical protein [Acidiphilium sp.]MDD4937366.1 hypothetical protein [Acidiphilium sp.]
MARFQIVNMISGTDFGIYEAADAETALEVFAQDAGYSSYAALCEVAPPADGEIRVTEVA